MLKVMREMKHSQEGCFPYIAFFPFFPPAVHLFCYIIQHACIMLLFITIIEQSWLRTGYNRLNEREMCLCNTTPLPTVSISYSTACSRTPVENLPARGSAPNGEAARGPGSPKDGERGPGSPKEDGERGTGSPKDRDLATLRTGTLQP